MILRFAVILGVMETQIWTSNNVAAVTSARGKQAQITAVQPLGSLWRLLAGCSAEGKEEADWSACIWQTKVFSASSFPDGQVQLFHLLWVGFKKMSSSPAAVGGGSSERDNHSTSLLTHEKIKAKTFKKLIRRDDLPDWFQHLRLILLFS